MDVTSTYKYARISARKARDVAREIQGLPVSAALDLLRFTPRKGAELFNKTMKTALADAENNFELSVEGLYVKSAVVGEGPTFKRFKARARGSAAPIRKRTSHLTVVLSNETAPEAEETVKAEASEKKPSTRKKAAPKTSKAAAATRKKKEKPTARAFRSNRTERVVFAEGSVDEVRGMDYHSHPSAFGDLTEPAGVGSLPEENEVREHELLPGVEGRNGGEEWAAQAAFLQNTREGK